LDGGVLAVVEEALPAPDVAEGGVGGDDALQAAGDLDGGIDRGCRGHEDGLLVHLTVVGSLLPGWDATKGLSTLIHSIMIGSMSGPDDPTLPDPAGRELTAREAAARLGVKVETLYAYVSRGMLE